MLVRYEIFSIVRVIFCGTARRRPLKEEHESLPSLLTHVRKMTQPADGNLRNGFTRVRSDSNESHVLVLFTGGTIGMKSKGDVYGPVAGFLPEYIRTLPQLNDQAYIEDLLGKQEVAESSSLPFALPLHRTMKKRVLYSIVEYDPLLDSSDMSYDEWLRIADDIRKNYDHFDGFVVLHGTDTLAYTASALSFMLENLAKPVVITGSQIPIGEIRSDGTDNLVGALVTAGHLDIPEVCVYFSNELFRGNRTVKTNNTAFAAFDSPNMQPLANMSINIKVNEESIFRSGEPRAPFAVCENYCRNVSTLLIVPSMSINSVRSVFDSETKGVILQSFGAGNIPTRRHDIIQALKKATDRGVIIVNITQCLTGQVAMHYEAGKVLYDIGVIPGSDMTAECAMTKMCYVLGKTEWDLEKKKEMLQTNLRGEMTILEKGCSKQLGIIPQIARALHLGSTKEIVAITTAVMPALVCHAASNNDVRLLEQLKESGAAFSLTDCYGRTALHVAASGGHAAAVCYLIQQGVRVNAKDSWGYTPLMCAVSSAASIDCIAAIREAGGVLGGNPRQRAMELCCAAADGDIAKLRAFAAAGANLSAADYDGRTPMHVAVAHNHVGVVDFLQSIPVDPNVKDSHGRTPLEEARRLRLSEIEKLLVQAEAL